MKYIRSDDTGQTNSYGQIIRTNYCVDAKGRVRELGGGWPGELRGVVGDWVVFTGTMIRDDGNPDIYPHNLPRGYVDTGFDSIPGGGPFTVDWAIHPDGTPANLGPVRFVKVHTGVFKFGGFGECSTEIHTADTIGVQTDFPLP